jgi:hypothetical protein
MGWKGEGEREREITLPNGPKQTLTFPVSTKAGRVYGGYSMRNILAKKEVRSVYLTTLF